MNSKKTNFFLHLLCNFHYTFSAVVVDAFVLGQIVDNAVGGSHACRFNTGVYAFHASGSDIRTGNNGISFLSL